MSHDSQNVKRERLRAEYLRRAKIVDDASKRSAAMERDFLAKKVLNAKANEALEDFGRKRAAFGEWLLQVSDELFSQSETAPTNAATQPRGYLGSTPDGGIDDADREPAVAAPFSFTVGSPSEEEIKEHEKVIAQSKAFLDPNNVYAVAAPSADERKIYWLVERGQAEGQIPTIWWIQSEDYQSGKPYGGQWTEDANKASKFTSAQEAQEFAYVHVGQFYRVTEHIFLPAVAAPSAGTPRTDAVWDKAIASTDSMREVAETMLDHGKKLERELAEANDQRDMWHQRWSEHEAALSAQSATQPTADREGFYEKLWKDFVSIQRGDVIGICEKVERYYREMAAIGGKSDV